MPCRPTDCVAPAEVGGCAGLYACAGRAGDGGHVDLAVKFSGGCQRKKCELEGCCEASRIGYLGGFADGFALGFGKTVDISAAFIAIVLCEVYDFRFAGISFSSQNFRLNP